MIASRRRSPSRARVAGRLLTLLIGLTTLAAGGQAPSDAPARAEVAIPVPFTAPGKGWMSAALYDGSGTLVRTLAYARPVKAGFRETGRNAETGAVSYTVELSAPWTSLGFDGPPVGRQLGFDTSVGVANSSGDRRDRAAHWAGLSEGVVVDRPGSAALLPRSWGTLTLAPPPPAP